MTQRDSTVINCGKTLPAFLLLLLTVTPASAAAPKNVVLILADDLGWADTTLYGKTSLYETPNIERLAARGMTFSRAYASPICSPTRASILTGQNPARLGMTSPTAHQPAVHFQATAGEVGPPHQKCTNVKSATRLDPSLPTLGKVLKRAGYATAHFGKWHLGREPYSALELGFEVDIPHWYGPGPKTSYLSPWGYEDFEDGPPGEHIEDRMAREATAWLKARDRTKPFYLNYWQFSVHAPFGAKPELIDHYRQKIKRGEAQQSPTYAAMVHSLDEAVGSLLDAIDAEGVAEDTVIIFYSDNGGNTHCGLEETDASGAKYIAAITSNAPLRGGKGNINEGGVRVPAVVVWPGVTEPGSRSDVLIQSADLYPTILGMLNVEQPKSHVLDGVDFAPALRGKAMERGPIFTLMPGHGNTPHWLPPSMSVHHKDWKLIRTFYYGDNGHHQYRLFNLREDIGENNNLASTYPEKVRELDQLMEEYIVAAKVVVPQRNPNFDPTKFNPARIGAQAGGLKMPRSFQSSKKTGRSGNRELTANQKFMLDWITRGAEASIEDGSLRLIPASRQPFLTYSKLQANGPVEVRFRIRTKRDGTGRLQWRTKDQKAFPKMGQSQSFDVAGGDWQELRVPLDEQGRIRHLRIYLSDTKRPTEIDWIEISPTAGNDKPKQRWNFKESDSKSAPGTKQRKTKDSGSR